MADFKVMADFRELAELIGKVSLRPAAYAGEYDFYRAAAFIEGFVYARQQSGISQDSAVLKDFSRWLSEKLDRPRN
jgi:hypothetical protein